MPRSFLYLLLLFPCFLKAQNGNDRILRSYFPDNQARDQAVISARYAEAAHRYSYLLLEPRPPQENKRLIDTTRAFILHARQRVDSTLLYAADSSERAIQLMKRSEQLLKEADLLLRLYLKKENEEARGIAHKNALNRCAEASVDAFHASMLLGSEKVQPRLTEEKPSNRSRAKMEKDDELYQLMEGLKERTPEMSDYEKEAGRLELDRKSFQSVQKRYRRKIDTIEERIRELEKSNETTEQIDSLREEKELLELRLEDAKEQVANIDGLLQDRLFEHIGLDSSKNDEGTVFQTNRYGHYEDRPVPIDEDQPDGLIFRIQVGYYSAGNRPREKFEGLYPLWGEEVSEQYVRYCVGRFRNYSEAERARTYLREEGGFPDAFIVAYKDGEKIPVVEAIKKEDQ